MTQQPSKVRAQRGMLPLTLVLLAGLAAGTAAHAGSTYSSLAAYNAAAGAGSSPLTFADVAVPNNNFVDTFQNAATIAANRYAGWSLPDATVVGTNYAFGVAMPALIEDTTNHPLTLNLTDPSAVSVGFNLAIFSGGTGTVSVYDGTQLLASSTLSVADESNLSTFFGYVGTAPITSVTITPADSTTLALATNLQYSISAVPEPMSAAMAACGFLFLVGVRRRS